MATWQTMSFQDASTPTMFFLTFLHEYIMMFLVSIMTMITFMLMKLMKNKMYSNKMINNQFTETTWTVMPMMMLLLMMLPSIKILYLNEESTSTNMTIKAIGNQWYWSYEYPQFKKKFESYMITKMFRMMEVDNRMIIPTKNKIKLITSSNDVIHSFTVPSMGFKIDSVPGRLNQTFLYSNFPGIYYGQCSEICGINHSFMPIVIQSMTTEKFLKKISIN